MVAYLILQVTGNADDLRTKKWHSLLNITSKTKQKTNHNMLDQPVTVNQEITDKQRKR